MSLIHPDPLDGWLLTWLALPVRIATRARSRR